ncbi:outer membrane protein [Amaricoccus macauensis]|uniref:outer membrane protein n=1 Tax=Amaricoccus macauensis TaxID=57001 RepID=UPI003C7B260F
MTRALSAALTLVLLPAPVFAEHVVSVYGGYQFAQTGDMTGEDTDGTDLDFDVDWEGKSFDAPPYWGVRYAYWRQDDWGGYVDFTHVKLYADDGSMEDAGFDRLEFTDGLNVLTVGVQKRFPMQNGLVPYLGGGLGFTYPHVETRSPAASEDTFGYQFGGFAAEIRAGAAYAFNDRWQAFAEYEGNYAALDVDMDGGGSLESDLFTHAINFGVNFVIPATWY